MLSPFSPSHITNPTGILHLPKARSYRLTQIHAMLWWYIDGRHSCQTCLGVKGSTSGTEGGDLLQH